MQMRENKGFCSFAFDSAHVKYSLIMHTLWAKFWSATFKWKLLTNLKWFFIIQDEIFWNSSKSPDKDELIYDLIVLQGGYNISAYNSWKPELEHSNESSRCVKSRASLVRASLSRCQLILKCLKRSFSDIASSEEGIALGKSAFQIFADSII